MLYSSINRIWIGLLIVTGITYWLGETSPPGPIGMGAVAIMLALTLLKGLWIINDFMELRHAPPLWRRLIMGWLIFVIAMIALAYGIGLS